MIEVRVPDEQEGTKAVVRAWLKAVGDSVAENDPLVELETDKVTQEVPSPAAGVLAEIALDTDAEAVPEAHLRQMAAYVAALEVVFPNKRVAAALLYTAAPRLIALPPAQIEAAKPGFAAAEDNF